MPNLISNKHFNGLWMIFHISEDTTCVNIAKYSEQLASLMNQYLASWLWGVPCNRFLNNCWVCCYTRHMLVWSLTDDLCFFPSRSYHVCRRRFGACVSVCSKTTGTASGLRRGTRAGKPSCTCQERKHRHQLNLSLVLLIHRYMSCNMMMCPVNQCARLTICKFM